MINLVCFIFSKACTHIPIMLSFVFTPVPSAVQVRERRVSRKYSLGSSMDLVRPRRPGDTWSPQSTTSLSLLDNASFSSILSSALSRRWSRGRIFSGKVFYPASNVTRNTACPPPARSSARWTRTRLSSVRAVRTASAGKLTPCVCWVCVCESVR